MIHTTKKFIIGVAFVLKLQNIYTARQHIKLTKYAYDVSQRCNSKTQNSTVRSQATAGPDVYTNTQ